MSARMRYLLRSRYRRTGCRNIEPGGDKRGGIGVRPIPRSTPGRLEKFMRVVSFLGLHHLGTTNTSNLGPGEPDSKIPLPNTADLVQTDVVQCDDLIAYMSTISPPLREGSVKTKQACYLPRHMRFGDERGPLLGPTGVKGLWVASGHTCWGIQNGPGSGYVMAEWILRGEIGEGKDVDVEGLKSLDPRRFKV